MDVFDELLATARTDETRLVRVLARTPWGIAFPARNVARLVLVSGAPCWLSGETLSVPRRIEGRACLLIRAGVTFELADEAGRRLLDCDAMVKAPDLTATVGGQGEPTYVMSSRFAFDAGVANAMLAPLPEMQPIDLDAEHGRSLAATFRLVAAEADQADAGVAYVVSRLTEVLFVQALRACYAENEEAMGWLAALRDSRLGPALRAFHDDPAHPWTIEQLAAVAGMSRTSFIVLFRRRTGSSPHDYLTLWRLHRAKRLLTETDRSVAQIAIDVGYGTGQSLSRAFSRTEGVAPGHWRAQR